MVKKAESKNNPGGYCIKLFSVAVVSFLVGNNFNGWSQFRYAASPSSSTFQSVVDALTNKVEATASGTTKPGMIVNGYKSMGANSKSKKESHPCPFTVNVES